MQFYTLKRKTVRANKKLTHKGISLRLQYKILPNAWNKKSDESLFEVHSSLDLDEVEVCWDGLCFKDSKMK